MQNTGQMICGTWACPQRGRLFEMAAMILLIVPSQARAQDHPALNQIVESHNNLRALLEGAASVKVWRGNTQLPSGELQEEHAQAYAFQNGEMLLKTNGDVFATNSDYRFRLNNAEKSPVVHFLEGKKRASVSAKQFESSKASLAFSSIYFGHVPIAEMIKDPRFKVESVVERKDANTEVRGTWEDPETESIFRNIALILDPSNYFQVLSYRSEIERPTYSLTDAVEFSYSSEELPGTRFRPPEKTNQTLMVSSRSADADTSGVQTEITYSEWSNEPIEPQLFRLSGYGIDEPDLGVLNRSPSYIRVAGALVLAALSLVIIFYRQVSRQ